MDVLSSIWGMLTMENEMVSKIVAAPTIVIEAWLLFELVISIFKINYNFKQKILYISLISFNSLITEFAIPSPYNTFVNYIIMFIITKYIFNLNILKGLLATIAPIAIFAITGTLILRPFLLIFNTTYAQVENTILYRLLYLIINYSFVYLINRLFKNRKNYISFKEDFNILPNRKIIILNILLGILTICIQLTITVLYTDVLPAHISFLSFISLVIYFFINFYSLTKTMKLQITTMELKNAENYNKTLSILYDNVKAFKHDFDNMVFTIGGFINTNDMNGLKKYYKSLEKECQKTNSIALLNPTLINNPGIYNLLTIKYQEAQNKNVDIQLEFFFDLNKLQMPIYDFSRMLGILLDNAIEAASVSKEKIVKIMFRDSSKSRVQILEIKNSYINKNIDIKTIFNKGVSEKENHLGMGLWEVKQIILRNNNTNLITENDDLCFKQHLEIYY